MSAPQEKTLCDAVPRRRLQAAVFAGMALLTVALGAMAAREAARSIERRQRTELLSTVVALANAVGPVQVRVLAEAAHDPRHPAFLRVERQMHAAARAAGLDRVYCAIYREGLIFFGPSALGKYGETAPVPGALYERPPPELIDAFTSGEARVAGPHTDEYGSFVEALVPVPGWIAGGAQVVIGAGIQADRLRGKLARARRAPMVFTVAVLGLLLLAYAGWVRRVRVPAPHPWYLRHAEALLCGALGTAVTLALAGMAHYREGVDLEHRFGDAARPGMQAIAHSLDWVQTHLSGIGRFFENSEFVDRSEFRAFVAPLLVGGPSDGWAWALRVEDPDALRGGAVGLPHSEGLASIEVWEAGADGARVPVVGRPVVYPLLYVEPGEEFGAAIGFDLGSELSRRQGLEQAARTGMATASAPIILNARDGRVRALQVYQPVFAGPREGNPAGFVLVVVPLERLIEHALQRSGAGMQGMCLTLHEWRDTGDPELLDAWGDAASAENVVRPRREAPLFAFGRTYVATAVPDRAWLAENSMAHGLLVLLVGGSLVLLLSMLVGVLTSQRQRLERDLERGLMKLRESESQYRCLFEDAHTVMLLVDPETGVLVDANTCAASFYGRSRQELQRMRIFDLNPAPEERIREGMARASKGEQGLFRFQHLRADGTACDVEVHSGPLSVGGRTLLYSIVHDVTDRIRAEQDVRKAQAKMNRLLEEADRSRLALLSVVEDQKEAEDALGRERALLRTVIDNLPDGICLKDSKLRIRLLNQAQVQAIGVASEEHAIGRTDADFFPPETASRFMDADYAVLKSGRASLNREETLPYPGRTPRSVLTSRLPVVNDQGEVTGLVSISRDVTERKELEDQFRQAQKMESIGRLAGGIAHDFNNMLQSIFGNTELALEEVEPGSMIEEDLVEIRNAARRSAELTGKLLAFARRQSISPETLDLNEAVGGTLPILSRMIGENIELTWHPGSALWPIRVDPSQLDQVLTNLAVNARDAIAGSGTLSIATENVSVDETFCESHIDAAPGEYVRLTVSDTGSGMSREVLSHIFEPFFTTKEKGKGTGLGLATVYGIVRQNNGFIYVYSEHGMGTTFRIYLPRTDRAAEAEAAEAEDEPVRGDETLLVVEDEAAILKLAQRILEHYGYTVIAALSPEDAIEMARQHPQPIHLLLTDIVMPGMNGPELVEKVVPLRPGIRVLYMSGYTADLISRDGILGPEIEFIAKPFSSRSLAAKVRSVLDAPASQD